MSASPTLISSYLYAGICCAIGPARTHDDDQKKTATWMELASRFGEAQLLVDSLISLKAF